jgi:hypothetical protein
MAGTLGGIRKMLKKATKTAKKMLAGVFKGGRRRTVKAGRRRRSRR